MNKSNASGNDRNLAKDGDNRYYWYSINDIMSLLIHTRKKEL